MSAGLICSGLGLSLAHAQSPPDAAGQLERDRGAAERQRQLERNRLDYPPPGGTAPAPPPTEAAPPDETCLPIETIAVTGVTLLTEAVRATARAYEGRCLGLAALNDLLEQLTFLYLAQGYITSRAFLPEQDLADGALEIVIIEGRLADIVMDAAPGAHQGQIQTAFPGQIGAPVNLRDLGLFTLFLPRLLCSKLRQSRRAERSLVTPNERQATPSGAVWNTTRRAWLFCAPAALSVAYVV